MCMRVARLLVGRLLPQHANIWKLPRHREQTSGLTMGILGQGSLMLRLGQMREAQRSVLVIKTLWQW